MARFTNRTRFPPGLTAGIPSLTKDGLTIDLRNGLPEENRAAIRDGWQNTLPDLVAELPEFGSVYEALEDYIDSLVDKRQL